MKTIILFTILIIFLNQNFVSSVCLPKKGYSCLTVACDCDEHCDPISGCSVCHSCN